MKVTNINVTLNRKVNDGDYGSFGADVSASAELEEGEKLSSSMAMLTKRLIPQLDSAVQAVQGVHPVKPKK